MKSIKYLLSLLVVSAGMFFTVAAQTATPSVRLQPFLTGLSNPLFLTHAKDNSGRIFIVQQGGIIKVLQPGETVPTDFLNITSKVTSGGERGLLGLAFHPQFASNGYFFVNYTRASDGDTVIARYRAINNNTVGDPNSEVILLVIDQPFSNHNGGMIEFRQDNGVYNLYIGMGDGGSGNDPLNNAQNINSLLGKFLRITPSVEANPTSPYTIPADNPYVNANGADEIYALGVRNPFRWSFDRETKQLWAGDVGQASWEEVSIINRAGNYGWRVYEGAHCTDLDPGLCNPANYTPPIFEYSSGVGSQRCSITGGYVYRGKQRTLPEGAYIYGDYCTGEYLMWFNNQQILIEDTTRFISSFGEDQEGELYIVGLNGTVDKITRLKSSADFDGDFSTDFTVFRPSDGTWYFLNPRNGAFTARQFGTNGDIPAPEDYDGDGRADFAVFRPSNGTWYYIRSSDNTAVAAQFGAPGDIPVAGDYDGDAKADLAVFRPSAGAWYILNSSTNSFSAVSFGTNGDIPVPADYDSDGRYDITVFRPSNGTWYRLNSSNNAFTAVAFGQNGDIPAPGDFDGDTRVDYAVFRNGEWYILSSTAGFQGINFGTNGDIPVVGDYNNDGREDVAVFRPSNGSWYVLTSSSNTFLAAQFGTQGDLPAPNYDKP